jgi:hypothetical protein
VDFVPIRVIDGQGRALAGATVQAWATTSQETDAAAVHHARVVARTDALGECRVPRVDGLLLNACHDHACSRWEIMADHRALELVCDSALTARLGIKSNAGGATRVSLSLRPLDLPHSPRLSVEIDPLDARSIPIADGSYVVASPQIRRFRDLSDSPQFDGQTLQLMAGGVTWLEAIDEPPLSQVLCTDFVTGGPIGSAIACLEGWTGTSWIDLSSPIHADSNGRIAIEAIAQHLDGGSIDTSLRLRIEAPGYVSVWIDHARLPSTSSTASTPLTIPLTRRAPVRIRIERDARPFRGELTLVEWWGNPLRPRSCDEFRGAVDGQVLELHLAPHSRLALHAGVSRSGTPILEWEVPMTIEPRGLHVLTLPTSAAIVVDLARSDPPPNIVLMDEQGAPHHPIARLDELAFEGLYPGTYRVIESVAGNGSKAIRTVTLTAGERVVVAMDSTTEGARPIEGVVRLANLGPVPRSLYVVPTTAMETLLTRADVIARGAPVDRDGRFASSSPREAIVALTVMSRCCDGSWIELLRVPIGVTALDVPARAVSLEIRDSLGPRDASLLLSVPGPDAARSGIRRQQLLIPYRTNTAIALGVLPTSGMELRLVLGDRSHVIDCAGSAERIVVALP